MKISRVLLWLIAVLPALAAFLWSSLAARFPESMAQRRSLGECLPQWDFPALTVFDAEPAHLLSRLVHMSLLHIPGVTMQWTAVANAVLAVLLALALARLIRRDLATNEIGRPMIFLGAALLACSPSLGADWLHGERVGRFAVPLLFVVGLLLLGPGKRFGLRAVTAILLAALAPLCHDRGAFVFLALLPALLGPGRLAWVVMLLLVGNIAAVASFYPAGQFHLADAGMFGALFTAPGATIDEVLRTTGSLWPDVLAEHTIDERVLGWLTWLSPLLLLLRRREVGESPGESPDNALPGDAVPQSAVPQSAVPHNDGIWWSCVAFGLLSVAFHHERHGMAFLAPEPLLEQARDELLFGGFLLPIGVAGLLASRFGAALWPLAGGVLLILAVQDWQQGAGKLRVARAGVERVEATVLLPDILAGPRAERDLPTRDLGELLLLEERGWVPATDDSWIPVIQAAVDADPDPAAGTFLGGDARELRGAVRPVLVGGQIGCVLIGVSNSAGEPFQAIASAVLQPDATGANLLWTARPVGPISEGARVRAVGIDVRNLTGARIGETFTVRGGVLDAGPAPADPVEVKEVKEGK